MSRTARSEAGCWPLTTSPISTKEKGDAVVGSDRTERFHSLDVLRGIAALGIVFWHWKAFAYVGTHLPGTFQMEQQPLFVLFAPLYRASYLAVDLFFSLSGFIFYALYAERISSRSIGAPQFLVLRLSRLYPLHLLTLGFVAGAQAVFLALTHDYFVYANNDAYHFILNLFFASSWGLEKDHSFNGPFWSVSVEAVLYAAFFLLCRYRSIGVFATLAMSALGLALWSVYGPIAHGLFSFFLGGAMFLVYRRSTKKPPPRVVLALILSAWLLPIIAAEIPAIASWRHFAPMASMYMRVVVFPATIYALALYETRRGTLGKRFAVLGDISYATYMLHFPLQLTLAIAATLFGASLSYFMTPQALVGFFALLLPLSYASHRLFEMPVQSSLRRRFLRAPAQPVKRVGCPRPVL
jgi:peptidoglycan/LPS O-acetylase OafA/YrhL